MLATNFEISTAFISRAFNIALPTAYSVSEFLRIAVMLLLSKFIYAEENDNRQRKKKEEEKVKTERKKQIYCSHRESDPRSLAYKANSVPLRDSAKGTKNMEIKHIL